MRGAPGCGKSTWIEENGLKPYAVSPDDVRLMVQSPVLTLDGGKTISQENETVVWKTVMGIIEERMKHGEFTVVDATNVRTLDMNRYKELAAKYRYRIYCVDFSSVPIAEAKRRNLLREQYKRVPEKVIDNMYARLASNKVPSGITKISPDELDKVWLRCLDFSQYSAVHVIGDIHGCNTALQKYFADNGGIKDDEMYIFCGDYIDRGIENARTLEFMFSLLDRKNVLMLEGNHEKWLWMWANDEKTYSVEFESVTKSELEKAAVSKKDTRNFYRRLAQCAYFSYGGKVFLVTHGGISTVPENLSLVSTEQMVFGVGGYDDFERCAESFFDNTAENVYQIHGHRNTKLLPVKVNDRVFNLEGQVEFGGCLRCVRIDREGIAETEVRNEVYKLPNIFGKDIDLSEDNVIEALRANRYVMEKKFGNISSFNFTEKAFFGKIWDAQTTRARGLYMDTEKNCVAARAYDKFFDINERPETKLNMLPLWLKFPVTAYVKENGYLGIVSYNEYDDELFVTTKSNPNGEFAVWLRKMLEKTVAKEKLTEMKKYIKENNVSFVFECVDMENDPHIIEYPQSKLVLLDIVQNKLEFEKYSYEEMCEVGNRFGIKTKAQGYTLNSWQEFYDWYFMVNKEDYEYNGEKIEGFVIEDSEGKMVKLKLYYYNFWKSMRSIAQETMKRGETRRTSLLSEPKAERFYKWLKNLRETGGGEVKTLNICTLRKMFEEQAEL